MLDNALSMKKFAVQNLKYELRPCLFNISVFKKKKAKV